MAPLLASSSFTHTPEPSSMWQVPELSPLVLCPGNTRPFGLSRLSAPSPQLKDPAKLCPGASSWHHSLETHSHHTSPLACFQHHSLPDVQRLEKHCSIYLSGFLVVSGRRVDQFRYILDNGANYFYTHRISWSQGHNHFLSTFLMWNVKWLT